jgi:hypothetical protein
VLLLFFLFLFVVVLLLVLVLVLVWEKWFEDENESEDDLLRLLSPVHNRQFRPLPGTGHVYKPNGHNLAAAPWPLRRP